MSAQNLTLSEVSLTVEAELNRLSEASGLTRSAIVADTLRNVLTRKERQEACYSRVWNEDGTQSTTDNCGLVYTLTLLPSGVWSCSNIPNVTYFANGVENVRADMKQKTDTDKLPTDHDTAERNAETRINGHVRNVLDDRETLPEAEARKRNVHSAKQAEALKSAQSEAEALRAKLEAQEREMEELRALISAQANTKSGTRK